MASITLKDIPATLHRRLKARAKKNGRSLNKEAILCLEEAVRREPGLLADARRTRERGPK